MSFSSRLIDRCVCVFILSISLLFHVASVASVADGAAVVDVNLMFRSFPTISDNKMVSAFIKSRLHT